MASSQHPMVHLVAVGSAEAHSAVHVDHRQPQPDREYPLPQLPEDLPSQAGGHTVATDPILPILTHRRLTPAPVPVRHTAVPVRYHRAALTLVAVRVAVHSAAVAVVRVAASAAAVADAQVAAAALVAEDNPAGCKYVMIDIV